MTDTPDLAALVKSLEWKIFEDRGAKASAFLQASYMINQWSDGRWELSFSYPGYSTGLDGAERWHPTLAEAQAAAQADYIARVTAALDPAAIKAMLAEAERRGMERAAAIVDNLCGDSEHPGTNYTFGRIAAAIRAEIKQEQPK